MNGSLLNVCVKLQPVVWNHVVFSVFVQVRQTFVVAARCAFTEFKTCFLQCHPALQSQGRRGGGLSSGRGTAGQTGNREREWEEQEGGETLSFSLNVPRNLSEPFNLRPLALQGRWVLGFSGR